MLRAGIGPTHVNEVLLCINVPSVGESTLKAREREVGPQIEKLVKESCLESLKSERNLWKEGSEKENVAIGASYDMGQQKRGKAHNSLGTLQILHLKELKRVRLDMHFHRMLLFFFSGFLFSLLTVFVSWSLIKVN